LLTWRFDYCSQLGTNCLQWSINIFVCLKWTLTWCCGEMLWWASDWHNRGQVNPSVSSTMYKGSCGLVRSWSRSLINMKGFLMKILYGWCNIGNYILTIGHNDRCNCKPWSCHYGMYPYEWNSKWNFHIVVSNCKAFICTSHMHPILLFS